MKLTVFTGNQLRHLAFINALTDICDELYVIQECKTIFPGKVKDITDKSDIMESYFSYVSEAERKVFGTYTFLDKPVKTLAIKNGDLSFLQIEDIPEIKDSDYYIVFGASYIKGTLFEYLLENNAINLHMGISPYYRGSACNFWAMFDKKPDYVGATIHLLSRELDGGAILYHALPKVSRYDAYELGMRSVEAAIYSLQSKIENDELDIHAAVEQERVPDVRISKRIDFNDHIVEEYMRKTLSMEQIYEKLLNRDDEKFIKPWIME